MKRSGCLFLLIPFFSLAQDKLLVQGITPSLYLTHKVAPKENYYSIGRIYNVSPKDIAPFNNLQLDKGLSLGQEIRIPLNSSNFAQSGKAANDETFVPLYYTVKEKEGLYRIAKNHNDLPLETLKQWNKITGDAVKKGEQLVVGYLKVKKELSGLAKNGTGTSIGSAVITVKEEKTDPLPEALKVPVEVNGAEKRKPKEKVKEQPAREAETKAVVAAETKISNPEKITPIAEPKKTIRESNRNDADFKTLYEVQIKNAEIVETAGKAGVFKSTSGWNDKKYYCLHNSSVPGTILKITNPVNGNFVFAKVLDNMPDIKKNDGLLLVVSNAAADALGAGAGDFDCFITFAK